MKTKPWIVSHSPPCLTYRPETKQKFEIAKQFRTPPDPHRRYDGVAPLALANVRTSAPPPLTERRELRHIFHALVWDGDLRGFIERGECAQIRSLDAGLYQAIKTVGSEGVTGLVTTVRHHVANADFVRVA